MAVGLGLLSAQAQVIKTEIPARKSGQEHMVCYAAPKVDTVKVGFIGLGMRGPSAVERFMHIPGAKVTALCDIEPDRVAKASSILKKAGAEAANEYSGSDDAWKKVCEDPNVNLVYVVTDWKTHAKMAKYAMEQG